jgi:hypothetical protein
MRELGELGEQREQCRDVPWRLWEPGEQRELGEQREPGERGDKISIAHYPIP